MTFKNYILDFCYRFSDKIWLKIIDDGSVNQYSILELTQRVYDYCVLYRRNQVKSEDTVLIILKESLDLFASFFAVIIYGALPAYFAYPSPKQTKETFLKSLDNLVKYNDIKLLISYKEVIDILNNNNSSVENGLSVFIDHQLIESKHRTELSDYPAPAKEAFLQFSSGTTGSKKGVKISIEALFNQIDAYSQKLIY